MTTEREMFDELQRQWLMEGRRDSLAVLMDWLESRGVVGEMKMQRLADLELLRASEVHGYGRDSFRDVATFVDRAVQGEIQALESSPTRLILDYVKEIEGNLRVLRQPWFGYRVLMSMAAQISTIETLALAKDANALDEKHYVSVDFTCLFGMPGKRQFRDYTKSKYLALGIKMELKFMGRDASGRLMWMPAYTAPVIHRALHKSQLNRIEYIAWPNRYEKSYQPMMFGGVAPLVPAPQNMT